MRVHFEPRYLLPESFDRIGRFLKTEPVWGSLLILGLFGAVLFSLHKIFKRPAEDLIMFAVIISGILILLISVVYTLTHVEGYRFGG